MIMNRQISRLFMIGNPGSVNLAGAVTDRLCARFPLVAALGQEQHQPEQGVKWWPTRSKQKLKTGDSCLIATADRFASSVLEWACSQQKKGQIISEHEDFLINELDTACQVIEPGDIVVTGADQDKARVVLQVFTLTPFLCYSNAIIIFPRACPSSE